MICSFLWVSTFTESDKWYIASNELSKWEMSRYNGKKKRESEISLSSTVQVRGVITCFATIIQSIMFS